MKKIIFLFCLLISCLSAHAQNAVFLNQSIMFANLKPGQQIQQLKVKPVEEWNSFMVPGAAYSAYFVHGMDTLGIFHGPTTEFLFYSSAAPAYKGPSHFRTYMRMSIMQSSYREIKKLFSYSFGANFSFEREVHRKALIPYYGLEIGGMHQKNVGSSFCVTPALGLHILSTQHITWYIEGNYNYAVNRYEELSGGKVTMGINVQLW